MKYLFTILLVEPLYNALVFLTDILTGYDIGWAVVILTLVVRFILFPLYHKSSKTQSKIKTIEPELKKLQEKYKDDKQEQSRQIMALYKEHGINPFSSFVLLLVQLPIIFALFYVFSRGFKLDLDILYSFIPTPDSIGTHFLGFFNISESSWFLAVIVGVTQFFQMKLALPPLPNQNTTNDFKTDLARTMQTQMRYVMPVV